MPLSHAATPLLLRRYRLDLESLTSNTQPPLYLMPRFRLLHIPPLLVATALTFGGLMPFWDASGAILEFGLPPRIAESKEAQTCFIVSGARVSVLGLTMWLFYLQGKLRAVDTVLALLMYVGAVDAFVCWQEGVTGKVVFRGLAGVVIGGWGILGMTARKF